MFSRCDETNNVTVAQTTCLPAYNSDAQLEQLSCISCVTVANAFVACKNNETVCRLLNHNPFVIVLKKGMKIAKITDFDTTIHSVCSVQADTVTACRSSAANLSRADLDSFQLSFGFKINERLDEEKRYEVLELLHRYKSVFARDMTEIKVCRGEPLELALRSHRKMFKRQYRLSEPDNVEMTRQLRQMEKANIIERSNSKFYNSPTYLVTKKWHETHGR